MADDVSVAFAAASVRSSPNRSLSFILTRNRSYLSENDRKRPDDAFRRRKTVELLSPVVDEDDGLEDDGLEARPLDDGLVKILPKNRRPRNAAS
jgi:hypothetical protein